MLPSSARIFVCTQPVDMRMSFDGLAAWARDVLGHNPESGALFLFTGKRATTLKVLRWDKSGYCILYKRLARGVFRMPAATTDATSVLIEPRELALILEGIELPSRKLKVKTAARESRRRALHAIESMITQPGA